MDYILGAKRVKKNTPQHILKLIERYAVARERLILMLALRLVVAIGKLILKRLLRAFGVGH